MRNFLNTFWDDERGLAPVGSDIASSIRNPAHFCGTFGHKPTFGIRPVGGQSVIEDARDCDILVIGPLARSADDMETMLIANLISAVVVHRRPRLPA